MTRGIRRCRLSRLDMLHNPSSTAQTEGTLPRHHLDESRPHFNMDSGSQFNPALHACNLCYRYVDTYRLSGLSNSCQALRPYLHSHYGMFRVCLLFALGTELMVSAYIIHIMQLDAYLCTLREQPSSVLQSQMYLRVPTACGIPTTRTTRNLWPEFASLSQISTQWITRLTF